MMERMNLLEPSMAVLPSNKPFTFRQRNAIYAILYGLALCILFSMAWGIYVFLAFGGFDTVGSGSSFVALVENLLVIAVYFSLIIGCAYGFIKHVQRLFSRSVSWRNSQEEGFTLMASPPEDNDAYAISK
jgi:hypothetical protein